MEKRSPHRLKGKIIRIRRGLALYQTYASPYYFARILDPRNQRYKVRSTKETNRVEAARSLKMMRTRSRVAMRQPTESSASRPMPTASFRRDSSWRVNR